MLFLNISPQGSGPGASPAKFQHWREQTSVVQDVSAFRTGVVNLTGGAFPEQLQSAQVSADYFRLFGATPMFAAAPSRRRRTCRNGEKVVVLSHGFWTRRFAADPQMIGKTISLGGDPYVVIGILAPGFDFRDFGLPPDVWVPFQLDPNPTDQGHYFHGRRAAEARRDAGAGEGAAEAFRRGFPAEVSDGALGNNQGFGVEPIREATGEQRAFVAAGAGGRGELRAADCVRECGESAAGARGRPAARDRDPGGDRRRPRAHHPATADGERAALAGGRGGRVGARAWWGFARCSA